MRDEFGDRMKEYEAMETGRTLLPLLPVAARIDGRAFHTFTKRFKKPFDEDLHAAFVYATDQLLRESGAVIGYTQSDEISLILYQENPKSQIFFDGKLYKLTSVLASIATAAFNEFLGKSLSVPLVKPATFDCRVWQLPTKYEAVNVLLWREKDARRNSISSAAQAHYSNKELHGKSADEQQEMLFQKGINWADYPKWVKTGAFYRKQTVERELCPDDFVAIPEQHRPPPGSKVLRTDVVEWPYELSKVVNKEEAIFDNAPPVFNSASAATQQ